MIQQLLVGVAFDAIEKLKQNSHVSAVNEGRDERDRTCTRTPGPHSSRDQKPGLFCRICEAIRCYSLVLGAGCRVLGAGCDALAQREHAASGGDGDFAETPVKGTPMLRKGVAPDIWRGTRQLA
jgi:hypothetical protein